MTIYPIISIKDFGPFKQASLELKPLTLLIGRNSVGKSMLAYLVWILASLIPDPEIIGEIAVEKGVDRLATETISEIRKGGNVSDKIKNLLKIHIDALPEAISVSLKESLQRTFTTNLEELIRKGASQAIIGVEALRSSLKFAIEDNEVKVIDHKPYMEFFEKLRISVPRPRILRVTYVEKGQEKKIYEDIADSIADLVKATFNMFMSYVVEAFYPLFSATLAALLPDSRAGIARTLLKPYTQPAIAKKVSYADEEFISLYFRLAEMVERGLIDLDMVKPLFKELSCTPEVVFERGVYTVYINTWTGKRLPLAQAPSGVRESLTVALALASRKEPYIVIVEEPEAHLHPRAQRVLARLIARSINSLRKHVVITTHSDYILYVLNNLITLSHDLIKAEKLGYRRDEVLKPDMVSAYLVRAEDGKAVLDRLEVGDEGISEDEFVKVAEELAEERSKILA
ncbi:AAA family ATPase [Staphylothermus hellenicus]|uniref:Endonuclease GajA/Old nuclease/RecF-like AAA domain-containing protein n=1 Tax=Staphylothermus hellenicus (strain DSM 12710 / JCM 10830 / BK20S6-10-b1 / P8) TaxID=591019 RepID=D7D871_STAHD|nr:AAA family ATPase [Staphylothermus hellenicus]ADI31967.1 conserved hypothetical protein [Staphylothermus hellenicus DSM 12710]